jgi:RNA polymerase sigma factor (sigma-70 family)
MDRILLERWYTQRDAEAFKVIAQRHAGMVFATCCRVLRNATDAEDVAQECFETLCSTPRRPSRNLASWLHTVAVRRAMNRIRAEKRHADREASYAAGTNRTVEIDWNDLSDLIDEAIAELPGELSEPLVRHFFENETHDDIAQSLGVTRSAVTYRIRRATERMRASLQQRGVEVTGAALGVLLAENAVAEVAPYALAIKLTKLALAGPTASVFGTSVGLLSLKVAAVFAVAAVAGIAVWQGIGSRESVSVFLGDTVGNPQSADPSLEPILLEFTPTLGEPITYEITVNLDKITLGRTGNENVSAVTVMTPGKRLDDGYAMTMTVHVNSHNLDELIAEHMVQKADAGKALTISDAFVFSGEDGPSLYFPQTPVSVGDSWEAEGVFAFGDLLTLDPPLVRWRFTVNRITPEADRTLAHIGVELLTHEAEVPFQMGRAGIRCNEDGTVSELEGDAAGKLRVGDRIIAIGGKPAPDPRTRSILTQNFIEDLDLVNEPVQLTIERDGNELNVSVEKSVVSLGTIGVTFSDYTRTSIFDVAAGLLNSDDSTANIELRYTITPETDFLDDLRGRTESPPLQSTVPDDMPPRIYHYHWKMNRLANR